MQRDPKLSYESPVMTDFPIIYGTINTKRNKQQWEQICGTQNLQISHPKLSQIEIVLKIYNFANRGLAAAAPLL